MSAIKLSQVPLWGWETSKCYNSTNVLGRTFNNTMKVLGYFPFTGPCLAIIRAAVMTIGSCKGEFNTTCARKISISIRIGIEFTGLGFLILPLADLIVTIHRGCTKKPKVNIEPVRNSEAQDEIQPEPQDLNLDVEESEEQKKKKALSQLEEKIHDISVKCANFELIIDNSEFLIEPFKQNDFNLLFRRSVTDEEFIDLFYFLMTNKDILKIDIRSHGEHSGDALELATIFGNEKAIIVLDRAYQE